MLVIIRTYIIELVCRYISSTLICTSPAYMHLVAYVRAWWAYRNYYVTAADISPNLVDSRTPEYRSYDARVVF